MLPEEQDVIIKGVVVCRRPINEQALFDSVLKVSSDISCTVEKDRKEKAPFSEPSVTCPSCVWLASLLPEKDVALGLFWLAKKTSLDYEA
jgi:hypothetical protein